MFNFYIINVLRLGCTYLPVEKGMDQGVLTDTLNSHVSKTIPAPGTLLRRRI